MSKADPDLLKKLADTCPQFFVFISVETFRARLKAMGPEKGWPVLSHSLANELSYLCQACHCYILVNEENMRLYLEAALRRPAFVICGECSERLMKDRDNAVLGESPAGLEVYSCLKEEPS